MIKKHLLIIALLISTSVFAQKKSPENWQTLDPLTNKIYGTGVEEAYKSLSGKTSQPVIVAVIDIGTDPNHEDLKDVLWTNAGEIPNNGIDDDKNGYADDVHGWSFLGGVNGDINYEATELARMYYRMSRKFKNTEPSILSAADAEEYKLFQEKIKPDFIKKQAEDEDQAAQLSIISDFMTKVKKQGNGVFSKSTVKSFVPENDRDAQVKKGMGLILALVSAEELEKEVSQGADILINVTRLNRMNADSIRQSIVGDNPNDPNERYYGNNHIQGPDALHGTHVAGIIAAMRNNNLGINGIANNVKIMIVRAVPNGDERDKDVANAIRYAVDNGAKVINMSFGKYYSPEKKVVDEAVQYALSKDVLLIHAAGNESKDKDVETSYPCRQLLSGESVNNWIEVGASAAKPGKNLLGSFSNYGKQTVDLYAPGVDIYSCIPDNKYISESGTSMAAPSTAGVAALIREYFPDLKANEVREVLMKTVVPYKKKVKIPGKKQTSVIVDLCISGGFLNANNAVKELLGLNKK